MVEGGVWREPALEGPIHYAVIGVEPGRRDTAGAIVNHPRPGEGEAIGVCSQVPNQVQVAGNVIQVVTGWVCGGAIQDFAGGF